jgi:hypothetical protein
MKSSGSRGQLVGSFHQLAKDIRKSVVHHPAIAWMTGASGISQIVGVSYVAVVAVVLVDHHISVRFANISTAPHVNVSALELADRRSSHRMDIPSSNKSHRGHGREMNVGWSGSPRRIRPVAPTLLAEAIAAPRKGSSGGAC